ncbi:MAG TPA: WecB/TagA/CpsF family glycosyltransferase [Thermoanaerobaculia bacterium]|nr:WecB/TagA/CpsF family glycosyltransferase [Thermoanaerobaculia bacterium]
MTNGKPPSVNALGTRVAALNLDEAVRLVGTWLREDATGRYVCATDVHCIMESYRRPEVRRAYNSADLCVPDGMPLTWLGRLRGNCTMNRVYGPDLMLRLLRLSAESGITNFFLGGDEGVADELSRRMTLRFPGLRTVGTHTPPFRPLLPREKDNLIQQINALQPDLIWVGLGAPKQDLFMFEFHQALNSKVMIGVGAAFDFHTGRIRQAPRWMMPLGLEWFFRLCVEPRRLGPRYLRNNPSFLWHIFLQETGIRHYPLD